MTSIEVTLTKEPRAYNKVLRISGPEAITPAVLEEVAGICRQNCEQDESGDHAEWKHMERNIRDVLEANLCPENGTSVLGPFIMDYVVFPKKGDQIEVIKGAEIHSTHPDFESKGRKSTRKQTVKVHQVHGGFVDHERGVYIVNPHVTWAGAGSYWKWTSLGNIGAGK